MIWEGTGIWDADRHYPLTPRDRIIYLECHPLMLKPLAIQIIEFSQL